MAVFVSGVCFYRLFGIFDDVLYVGLKGLGLHLFDIANHDTFRKWFAGWVLWRFRTRFHNRFGYVTTSTPK